MERPDLVEIKAATANNRRLSEFNLNVAITRQTTEDDQVGGAKGRKASAGKDAKP
jgi:hypothetical protein